MKLNKIMRRTHKYHINSTHVYIYIYLKSNRNATLILVFMIQIFKNGKKLLQIVTDLITSVKNCVLHLALFYFLMSTKIQ